MPWVEVGCADGLRLLVVSLWWLGCWVVVIEEVGMGFGCGFVVGFCCGLCREFFFFVGGWGLGVEVVVGGGGCGCGRG